MEKKNMDYAGFWRRFAAYTIDVVITGYFLNSFYYFMINQAQFGHMEMSRTLTNVLFSPVAIVISWCYFAGMESSPMQATLGKRLLGLYVTDMEGNRLSFGQATGRYFGKMISGFMLTVGYWLAGFTEKKQALHDIIANCLVLKR
jgi:uncharacterized RDD family membrane protein YckC